MAEPRLSASRMAPGVKNPGGDPSEIKAAIRVQSVQRGRLARRDAKRRLGMRVLGHALAPPKREMPKPLLRTLTVRLVELNRLWDIDIIGQRFKAELVVQLAFEGGATDPDLSRLDFAGFPLDGFGRPTFRPSAAWFMEQVDFNNALEYKTLDKKVFLSGDDIVMNLRFEGTFSEIMRLETYPCDVQDLTMSLAFNTRTTGMMPLEIINSQDLPTGVLSEGFVDGKLWDLHTELDVRPGTCGRTADRLFPSIEIVCLVGRQPTFVVLNVALPVFFFVPMAILQFCVPREMTADRLSVSLAIVLTTIAHKYSMTTMVPQLSYLTFLDKYVLVSTMLIVLVTFEGAALGMAESLYCRLQASYEPLDDEDPTDEDDAGVALLRRLVTKTGESVAASAAGITALRPVFYADADTCPPRSAGPLSMFDYIDFVCCLVNVLLWLLIQAWAGYRFRQVHGTFKKRVQLIEKHKEQARAEISRRKAVARGKLATSLRASMAAIKMLNRKASTTPVQSTQGAKPPLPRLKTFANLPERQQCSFADEVASSTPVRSDANSTSQGRSARASGTVPKRDEPPAAPAPAYALAPALAGLPAAAADRKAAGTSSRAAGRYAAPLPPLAPLPQTPERARRGEGRLSPRNLEARSKWRPAGLAASVSSPGLALRRDAAASGKVAPSPLGGQP